MRPWGLLPLFSILIALPGSAEECATRLSELSKSERLTAVKALFKAGGPVGFVNETKGSYFILEERDGEFRITFFTSGLFDLYPIKRDGPLSFCDTGEELQVVGLGRRDDLRLTGTELQLGGGGPKRHFAPGPMPGLLIDLHKVPQRGIASEN
ncbi:MAG: hypothetical protein KF799_09895 [Bdellovibrionales bacterium]|nr:hypothetical protein [Bdellovibrionales bacterium]